MRERECVCVCEDRVCFDSTTPIPPPSPLPQPASPNTPPPTPSLSPPSAPPGLKPHWPVSASRSALAAAAAAASTAPPPPRVAGVLGATGPGAASTAGKLCAYLVGTDAETDAAVHRVLSLASLYAHPSNSGRHSGALAAFLEAFAAHLAKRATGDADPRPHRTPTRAACPPAAITAAATAAAAVAGRAMFSKDGALASIAPRALADVCFLAPGTVLPLAARRLARALGADASPHQLAGGADAVAAVARGLLLVGLPPPDDEGGEFRDVEGGGSATLAPARGAAFLRDAVTALLPGLDANDADKTLAVLRLLAAALSSAGGGALPDDGDAPAPLCPVPPGLLDALLDRVLALLDALDSDGDRSDAATSGGGGGGGGGGGSFLLPSASALRPVLELAFARAPPSARTRASARLARWACARARPAVSPEAALLVNAAAAADPQAAAHALLPSLLDTADAALAPSSSATRAMDTPRLSSSAEAAACWALALVSACVYRAGSAAAAHAPRVRSLAASAAAAPSREVVQAASRLVASALAGLVGCYPLPERAEDSAHADALATVATFVDAGHLGDGDSPPRWHDGPSSAAEAELAAGLVEDHYTSAATAATAAAAADDREGVLAALASAEGVLTGGRGAVAEFDGLGLTDGAFVVASPRVVPLASPAARAALATAVASVAASTSDAACLAMAARVAGSLLAAGSAEHSEAASARAAAAADADVVAEPRAARIAHGQVPRRRLPRWLVIEKVAAAATWRAGQAAWRRVWGGATAARPSASLADVPPAYSALLTRVLLPLATCHYGSARVEAVGGVEAALKRLPAAGGGRAGTRAGDAGTRAADGGRCRRHPHPLRGHGRRPAPVPAGRPGGRRGGWGRGAPRACTILTLRVRRVGRRGRRPGRRHRPPAHPGPVAGRLPVPRHRRSHAGSPGGGVGARVIAIGARRRCLGPRHRRRQIRAPTRPGGCRWRCGRRAGPRGCVEHRPGGRVRARRPPLARRERGRRGAPHAGAARRPGGRCGRCH